MFGKTGIIARFVADEMARKKTARIQGSLVCPKCGDCFPFCIDNFDAIDVLRCPNCDALFERGRFVCYRAKSERVN